jgi:hypothetical protein
MWESKLQIIQQARHQIQNFPTGKSTTFDGKFPCGACENLGQSHVATYFDTQFPRSKNSLHGQFWQHTTKLNL